MYTYLKERKYYEDNYDRFTVEIGRRGRFYLQSFLKEFTEKLKQADPPEDPMRPGNVILGKLAYMQLLGYELLERYENRDQKITEQMEHDRARDQRIADTNLNHEPPCQHCGQLKLECTHKMLMHRDQDKELVLLTFRCSACHGYNVYWEDGAPLQIDRSNDESEKIDKANHSRTPSQESPDVNNINDPYYWNIDPGHDSDFARDRYDFCLYDETKLQHLRDIRDGIQRMSELGRYFAEQDQRKAVNYAAKQIKQLNVTEMAKKLMTAVKKKYYTNFNFSAPQMGRYLVLEFSCFDSKTDREERKSCRDLKRTIDKTLALTNWQLMSDGIHYRLGALSGRLKAIENPDEIRKLAEKLIKSGKIKPPKEEPDGVDSNIESTADGTKVRL